MKLQLTLAFLVLLTMVGLTGCYTQLGYYASADFDRRYHKVLEKEKIEHPLQNGNGRIRVRDARCR